MRAIMRIIEAEPSRMAAGDVATNPPQDDPENSEASSDRTLSPTQNGKTRQSSEHPLAVEARKYKTSEEFVKAQPVVFHGSAYALKSFEARGAFFTDDYMNADGYASGEHVYEGYLIFKNPFVIDAKGNMWNMLDTPYGKSTREVVANVDSNTYDGVIFLNVKDNWNDDADYQDSCTVYFAFNARKSFVNSSQLTSFYNKLHRKSSK